VSNGTHCIDELAVGGALDQVPARSRLKERNEIGVLGVHRKNQHFSACLLADDFFR
jgi:hypothetical protein